MIGWPRMSSADSRRQVTPAATDLSALLKPAETRSDVVKINNKEASHKEVTHEVVPVFRSSHDEPTEICRGMALMKAIK